MKRSTMKSDIAVRSRCQSEGRIFPRRKVASKSHLLNGSIGDFEMELSLAIQESLKYAQNNVSDSQDSKINSVSEDFSENNSSCCVNVSTRDSKILKDNNDPKSTSPNPSLGLEDEMGRMKDLLLAQAELIQCQQEEIAEKDKELKIIRVENDNLQCRLTRMERRLSVLRQKDGSDETLSAQATTDVGHKDDDVSNNLKRKGQFYKSGFKKRHKRHRLTAVKKSKWRAIANDHCHPQATFDNEEGGDSEREMDGSSAEDESGSDGAESDNESVSFDADKHTDSEDDEAEESEKRVYISYPVMQTESMYHLYYPKHLSPSLDLKKTHERAALQLEVETPTWRMNPLTNMYQLEGTENITDEAYFKRHQKFELEEKRRKRWDLQRLRELKIFEKFQEEQESALRASPDEADLETFLPSIHDLTHIEISSSIPVMAFGQPIPYISPAEFDIPWEMNSNSQAPSNRCKTNGGKASKRH